MNRGGPSAAKKKQKNDREKERVKNLREAYEALGAEVRVERGPSGHFSKVRTLEAAIRHIRELQEVMLQKTVKQTTTEEAASSPAPLLFHHHPRRSTSTATSGACCQQADGFFQEEIVLTSTEVEPADLHQ